MPGIDECLSEAMEIPGVLGASLVDWSSGLVLGAMGKGPDDDHEAAAAETTEVARAAVESGTFTADNGGRAPVEDIIITARGRYHLMRFLDTAFDSSVFLYLWLDRAEGNLAVAQFRLRALADKLVLV
ncbi:hypothetical protein [Actinacidiphila oryziradicis]|uniref:Roadblock/LC7 domain-containing protein n=1 Tax=Actinacidiphila oryziradicis TaxID=2571141 RepID=A0A4U0SHW6_9ACTN|nr:hypothetical protein [Actinacidiphila oryziradicis]MCW2870148.1 hypothetical protein [Actinacidiphila oryziradicis]TKA09294.1 hypothetical protein FCI23_23395 [Actinacidiphila oryziradicis]